jgi:hypothetical protein
MHEAFAAPAVVEETVVEEPEALAAESDDTPDDDEPETPAPAEPEAAVEPEVVQASAASRPVMYPAAGRRAQVTVTERRTGSVMLAAAGQQDVREGTVLNPDGLAQAMIDKAKRLGPVKDTPGWADGQFFPVGHVDFEFPSEFTLDPRDADGNARKIREAGSYYFGSEGVEAFQAYQQADGGICAPPTPFYDVPDFSTAARPIRDGLTSFRAVRGGVLLPPVSSLADAAGAITVVTADDDAEGGTFATKACLDYDCQDWTQVTVAAISHCRTYGNFNTITWPEGIRHENANTMAQHSRVAEGRLLQLMDALLIPLTANVAYGTSSTLLYALSVSRVAIISQLRLPVETRFQVVLPFWAATMFSMDIINGQFDRFAVPPRSVEDLLGRFGFDPIWHLDESLTGADEIFGVEAASGVQNDWPGASITARLFPRNHLLHLDGGTLDFGITRDIDSNAQNTYAIMGEVFESLGRLGPEQAGHLLTIATCPDGTVAAPDTSPLTCQTS